MRRPAKKFSDADEPPSENSAKVKRELLGRSAGDLRAILQEMGEPAYRGAQLYHAIYAERRLAFASMSNLPATLRQRLAADFRIGMPEILQRFHSSDASVRYLLKLPAAEGAPTPQPKQDRLASGTPPSEPQRKQNRLASGTPRSRAGASDARVETVFMPSEGRQTICISTQAGCAVDCHFCLTAQLGLIGNLSAGEILAQVLIAFDDNRLSLAPRTNVVLMGQGEPLLNYDAVVAALRIMLDTNGMGLAARHVTLSTSGIVPGIERLAQETVRPKLAISLNASSDEQRNAIMPINRKYPLEALLGACRKYPLRPWEKLTFEYVLLGGFNDSSEDARRVARLLAGLHAKVNLIPWNPGALPYRPPAEPRMNEFQTILAAKGIPAFVRYSRGQDVNAACGQLALADAGPVVATIASAPPPA